MDLSWWKTQLSNFCIKSSIERPKITVTRDPRSGKWSATTVFEGHVLTSDQFDKKSQAEGQICRSIMHLIHGTKEEEKTNKNGNINSSCLITGIHFVFIDVENVGDTVNKIKTLEIQGNVNFICIARRGNPLIGENSLKIAWKTYDITGKNASDFAIVYNIGVIISSVIDRKYSELVNICLVTKDNFGDILSKVIFSDHPNIRFKCVKSLEEFLST